MRLAWVIIGTSVGMGGPWGCMPAELSADGDATAALDVRAGVSDYVTLLSELGIWQAMERTALDLPWYLGLVPGVDGEGPFQVETTADVAYRATPLGALTLNVHRPLAMEGGLRRAVVLYTGGGYTMNTDFDKMERWADFLAARGIVTFNTRPRLLEAGEVAALDILADAFAAVRFVRGEGARFGADPERIATMGRSSGALLALLVGMHPDPDQFRGPADGPATIQVKAMIAIGAPTQYTSFAEGREFSILAPQAVIAVMGGTPAEVPAVYEAYSALSYVRPGLPPVMIQHGLLDTTVPFAHGVELADRMEAAGNLVWREFQTDTGHVVGWGLLHNEALGRTLVRTVRFLDDVL